MGLLPMRLIERGRELPVQVRVVPTARVNYAYQVWGTRCGYPLGLKHNTES